MNSLRKWTGKTHAAEKNLTSRLLNSAGAEKNAEEKQKPQSAWQETLASSNLKEFYMHSSNSIMECHITKIMHNGRS